MSHAEEVAALFPDSTAEARAEVLMRAGRVSAEDIPYVAAHINAAVAAERERCAKLTEERGVEDHHNWAYEFSVELAAAIRSGE